MQMFAQKEEELIWPRLIAFAESPSYLRGGGASFWPPKGSAARDARRGGAKWETRTARRQYFILFACAKICRHF